jgi:hypothetical protein
VVQVGGVDMVSATVTPAGCAAPWRPRLAVACLHVGEQGRCAQANDSNPAQVYFEPYSPGTTYVATGRGCGRVFDFTIDPTCQLLGPFNATL